MNTVTTSLILRCISPKTIQAPAPAPLPFFSSCLLSPLPTQVICPKTRQVPVPPFFLLSLPLFFLFHLSSLYTKVIYFPLLPFSCTVSVQRRVRDFATPSFLSVHLSKDATGSLTSPVPFSTFDYLSYLLAHSHTLSSSFCSVSVQRRDRGPVTSPLPTSSLAPRQL